MASPGTPRRCRTGPGSGVCRASGQAKDYALSWRVGTIRRRNRGLEVRVTTVAGRAARLSRELADQPRPRHVGIMLDGNRRWAKSVGHDDLSEGYKVGGAKVAEFLRWCVAAGIEHVTLFMLSDDNLH